VILELTFCICLGDRANSSASPGPRPSADPHDDLHAHNEHSTAGKAGIAVHDQEYVGLIVSLDFLISCADQRSSRE